MAMKDRLRRIFGERPWRWLWTKHELEHPYRMLPADDGGQTYRMECKVCKAEGSVMGKFIHEKKCPAREK